MEYRRLGNTDLQVSVLGYGASPLGDVFGEIDASVGRRAVNHAIDNGINFFDVSPYYGLTLAEERLGDALQGRRDEVVLATKCGRYGEKQFDFSAARVASSIEESLRRLRTDHVDLLQAHDVEFGDFKQIVEETIPAMRRVQEQGKARFIGITGYPLKTLLRIGQSTQIDTILTYCHYNLMVSDMDDVLTPFAKKEGIGLINASGLHMGVLTERGAPSWHPASREIHEAGSRVAAFCRERGGDIAKLALRFCLDHPYVSSTLVGMSSPSKVDANLELFDFIADRELMKDIACMLGPVHNRVWPSGLPENCD